VSLIR